MSWLLVISGVLKTFFAMHSILYAACACIHVEIICICFVNLEFVQCLIQVNHHYTYQVCKINTLLL